MSRKLRPLAALATVALIGAGVSNSFAANGNTGVEGVVVGAGDAAAEGVLAVKGSPPAPASPTQDPRVQQ
jgi:hypothetical protein